METLDITSEVESIGSFDPDSPRRLETDAHAPTVFLPVEGLIQILAHEMRGPLAPLGTAAALLRRCPSDPDCAARVADIVDRQVSTLARLIDDVLDAFRLRLGHLAIHREVVDLASVVATVVDSTRGFVASHGHALVTTLPDRSLEVACDPVRLSQVVQNLVTNAAKYTNRGGTIEVRVEAFLGCAAVTVIDDGIGLSPADVDSIFELYGQAGQSGTLRSEGGLGLGLFLARRLVEAHGGTLEAFSAGRGRGSRFVVRLPRPAATMM